MVSNNTKATLLFSLNQTRLWKLWIPSRNGVIVRTS